MNRTIKTVALSLSIVTLAATSSMSAAEAATNASDGKFKTFQATPKAPRVEKEVPRQIVVEPRQEVDKTPVAVLTPDQKPVVAEPAPAKPVITDEPEQQAAATPPAKPEDPDAAFAPQTQAEAEKVEMPTVFTDKQKELFNALGASEQKALVERLVKKYGRETMYPKAVTRNYIEDHKSKQSHSDSYQYNYSYDEPAYERYTSYGSGYTNCQ